METVSRRRLEHRQCTLDAGKNSDVAGAPDIVDRVAGDHPDVAAPLQLDVVAVLQQVVTRWIAAGNVLHLLRRNWPI